MTSPVKREPKPIPDVVREYEATCHMCGHLAYADRLKTTRKQRLCQVCFDVVKLHRATRQKPIPNAHALAGEDIKNVGRTLTP